MRNSALALALATVTSLLAQSSSSYRVTHTYTLGGDGSWDYIVPDPPNHRLLIARQNRVMVVDEDMERCSAKSPASRARTEPRRRKPRGMGSPPRGTTSRWSCSI
jgi:hypothetical protein